MKEDLPRAFIYKSLHLYLLQAFATASNIAINKIDYFFYGRSLHKNTINAMNYIEQYKSARDYDERILITINKMLYDPTHTEQMRKITLYNRAQVSKLLTNSNAQYELVANLLRMPAEIKKYIGAFSNDVVNQQKLVKIEFYNGWFKMHKSRIIGLMKTWTKKELAFVLNKITQADAFAQEPTKHNQTNIMLRSKIECIINKRGERSNHDMYSLLLAISNYDTKLRALTKSG
jgi:hypothetical protein